MSDSQKVKILVLGPANAGKTVVANFLCGLSRPPKQAQYHPTVGVRILEFERELQKPKKLTVSVELWDSSGDRKYEYGWPAMMKDANGILFIFNPLSKNSEKELENWHNKFAHSLALQDSQMLIFAHNTSGESQQKYKGKLGKNLARVMLENTSVEFDSEIMMHEFDELLSRICISLTERRYQEEQNILGTTNDGFSL